jgi:hypothetical protein
MASMKLIDGQAAREEAIAGQLSEQQARWLADACRRRSTKLGPSGVRRHAVAYESGKWSDLLLDVGSGHSLTRGDVFDVAASPAIDVFTASYIFGMGRRGYGRSRYDKIRAGALQLGDDLERVRDIGWFRGPIFAYAQLYGGQDYGHRSRPGTPPWSRIARYGPAFFTKFLYFAVPGALILDARLASRVARLTGKEHGYLKNGRPLAWTPYRYAVYLHWMRRAATDANRYAECHEISPELIELTLFDLDLVDLPPGIGSSAVATEESDVDDDGDAAN